MLSSSSRSIQAAGLSRSLARGSKGGDFDNRATVLKIAKLRADKAALDPSMRRTSARSQETSGGTDAPSTVIGLAVSRRPASQALGEPFVNQSVIGTRFTGRLVAETDVAGVPAVVPEITGRAWVTAMGQYLLDETDPFPEGFAL